MEIVDNYKKALEDLYNHVGFTEDWVIYPIDFQTDKYWSEDGNTVSYADSIEEFESEEVNFI